MSLLGKLFGGAKEPPSRPAGPPPLHDFTIDRDRMFDLDLTRRLTALVGLAPEARDDAWTADFFASLWNASIELPERPVFVGPDGFDYLGLNIPAPGAFESNSLANLVEDCLAEGCGAVLFPHPEAEDHAYVMPMGVLESLLRFGHWDGDPIDIEESVEREDYIPAGTDVIVSAPSAEYLSPQSAAAMDRYLKEQWGLAEPRVALTMCHELRPTRSLMINVRPNAFETEDGAQYFCRRLTWFLPPSRVVMLLPEEWDEARLFPLAQFAKR